MIRHAAEGDLDAIAAIYNAAVPGREATADTSPVAASVWGEWLARRSFDRRPVWVHELDGAVTGWLALEDFNGRPAYHPTAEVGVYVAPERRGRGVGGLLLERAVHAAPALTVSTLLGFILEHNQASLALFEAAGFDRWGLLPNVARMPDRERGVVIVGRRI